MKKLKMLLLCSSFIMVTSCATILRGAGNECQKDPSQDREPRVGLFLLDLVFPFPFNVAFLVTDIKTGAMYKPCQSK